LIVADAGPLIGLARIDRLSILKDLFLEVLIPDKVASELKLSQGRPGSRLLSTAVAEGWLSIKPPRGREELKSLELLLDPGEAEAILLAEEHPGVPLLIDERRGRSVARSRHVPVIGTGGVLLLAKQHKHIERVLPVLDRLAEAGYRLAPALRQQLCELAGEDEGTAS
jgi:predicted nucleic acid-binding protein